MRVTHKNMYSNFIGNMNSTLSQLVELNLQASTQKKVNRPSDDPVGMSRILDYRHTIRTIGQYQDNIDTSKGWLKLADDTLLQVNTVLTRARELAQQASTGTITADNREELSYEARQLFQQLVGLANTTYEGSSIFAGHKVDRNAYEQKLWMQSNDAALGASQFTIRGGTDKTALVRFSVAGGGSSATLASGNVSYEYSLDGGKTFSGPTAIPAGASPATLTMGGVQLDLDPTATVTAYDPNIPNKTSTGSWLWIRPTAQYMGDDEDRTKTKVDVINTTQVKGSVNGVFEKNTVVRIDKDTSLNGRIDYSYSLDNGANWIKGNVASNAAIASAASLVVPGGVLTIASNGGSTLRAGDQFVIRPRTAAINLEISANETIKINNVGSDIFGGVYRDPDATTSNASVVGVAGNLFEAMGKLVAALETNDQTAASQALESLRDSNQMVLKSAASVGGRENRLEIAKSVLTSLSDNQKERMSSIEDADLSELMTKLANQQIIYQAILKSSSMIMQMSLMNYV